MRARLRSIGTTYPSATPGPLGRLERVGVLAAALGFAALVAGQLLASTVFESRPALQPQEEFTIYAFASAGATLVAAVGALLSSVVVETGRSRNVVLAALLGYFAVDDMLVLHERVGYRIRDGLELSETVGARLWPAAYVPLLAVALVLLVRAASDFRRAGGRWVLAGLGALGLAVALEPVGIVTEWLERRGHDGPKILRRALEEALEQAGWTLVATGLLVGFAALLLSGQAEGTAEASVHPPG